MECRDRAILNISTSYNPYFPHLLKWYGITPGQGKYDYLHCNDFPDQKFLYDVAIQFRHDTFGDIYDRTNTLTLPYKYHYDRLWKKPSSCIPFDVICDNRVKELLAKNYDSYSIMWSGGLDSQCMLAAFINNTPNWKDRIVIHLSRESILEYPAMYDWLIKENANLIHMSYITNLSTITGHIVTGECGDMIHTFVRSSNIAGISSNQWKDVFKKTNVRTDLIERFENFLLLAGKEIKTYSEAFWWFWSIIKWQAKDYHIMNYIPTVKLNEHSSFYNHVDFEDWAYFNVELFDPDNYPTSWKRAWKDYIYKFDKNLEYNTNKVKVSSGFLGHNANVNFARSNNLCYFIADGGERITTPSLPYVSKSEFIKKYSNQFDSVFGRSMI